MSFYLGKLVIGFAVILFDGLLFLIGSFIIQYLKGIQKTMDSAIQKNDKATIIEQIELHKKVVQCFRLFEKVYGPIYFARFVFIVLGVAVAGFETTIVSFYCSRVPTQYSKIF